jgi:hypothetical protein
MDTVFTKEAKLKINNLFIFYYVNQWYILMDLSRYAVQKSKRETWEHIITSHFSSQHWNAHHTEREMEHAYKGCIHPIHYNLAITERN